MFDDLDGPGLLAEMVGAQRAERVAVARRILVAGRLCQVRSVAGGGEDERAQWCVDGWEAVAAEVGAELGISRGRASTAMDQGVALLERLPKVAAVFAAGEVDLRVIATVLFRTALIVDPKLLAKIDAALAGCVGGWNALSARRVAECVDWRVRNLDPAAERVARDSQLDRHLESGPGCDGLAQIWGSVRAPDAAALDRRLDALAATVCSADPRTRRQRRADALGALAGGQGAMVCECGTPECPAAGAVAAGQVVVHVLAEAATVAGCGQRPGLLPGYGALPAEAVRALVRTATVRPLADPGSLGAEGGYRPSRRLAEFVRARDLGCRFPGCDVPAEFCDIDHSRPWHRGGLTHPSNLNLKCRAHHLLKTFWAGPAGWRETQFPDGRIEWVSPAGRTYTTTPGGAVFFPQLAEPTGDISAAPPGGAERVARGLMMPTRTRTRAADRAARIAWERGLNEARWAADPPPF